MQEVGLIMPKNKLVNLLPQEEFEASVTGRVLKWAMGTFRIIVIVTEMIVMGAFLSRFWLDSQNSDLTDSINVRSAEISAQSDFENQFRQLQAKLSIFKQLTATGTSKDKLDSITSKVPQDVILSSLSVGENSAQVKGIAASELGVLQFMTNLKSESSLKSTDLASISSPEDNPSQINFAINISY